MNVQTGHEDLPTPLPWRRISSESGIVTYRLADWSAFYDFLHTEVFLEDRWNNLAHYVWRGHRRSDWVLLATLDRLFDDLGLLSDVPQAVIENDARDHLDAFKRAARGRRGIAPPRLDDENEWWALGQHYGLATPLLDWCRSPFAAAYFAFEHTESDDTEYRVIYGLDRRRVGVVSDLIVDGDPRDSGTLPIVQFVEPMSDDNPRLMSQGGLFTRTPVGVSVESWVSAHFADSGDRILLRVEVPTTDRVNALSALDQMNINHLSLFPDLTGAARYVNLSLELEYPWGARK
jgi:hypothetical protein